MDVALPPDAEAEDLIEYMPCQDEVYHEVGVAATDYDGEEVCYADVGLCGGFLLGSSDSETDDNFGLYYTSWGAVPCNTPRCG